MIKLNPKLGIAAFVAALFVAFGAFGLSTTSTSASPGGPFVIGQGPCTPNGGTPGAALGPGSTVSSGTVLCVRINFANLSAPLRVTYNTTGGSFEPNAAPPFTGGRTTSTLTLVAAKEFTSLTPAGIDVTSIAADDCVSGPTCPAAPPALYAPFDAVTPAAANTYYQSAATLSQYPVQPAPLTSLAYDLTVTVSCGASTAGLAAADGTIQFFAYQTSGPGAAGLTSSVVNCKALGTGTGLTGSGILSVAKIDQLGVIRGAQFAVQQDLGGGNWVNVATLITSGTSAAQNPCRTDQACATNSVNGAGGTVVPGSLPANVTGGAVFAVDASLRVIEIGQPTSCTLVEIRDGANLVVFQPVAFTVGAGQVGYINSSIAANQASSTARTLTFVNSCQTPLAPVVANSAIAVVIGGATQGLSNSTHIEIVPAPGSDDDARVDIRIRDTNSTNVVGAHVTMSIDKGAMSMRTETASNAATNCVVQSYPYGAQLPPPNINPANTAIPANCYNGSGYEVIEPAPGATYFGSNYAGDTCDQGITQPGLQNAWTWNPVTNTYTQVSNYSGSIAAPFLGAGTGQLRQIQDGFTNTDGIVSACVYVNPDLAPGVTPGKMNITVIVEAPAVAYNSFGYGVQNIILTATVTVVGPPASIKVAASPTSVQCGEKSTITATVTDSVGQNVSDHTRVELVSNAGATIGGTGSTLGFPGVGAINPASSSVAETFSSVATAFLLTSTEHVGPYEVVVASGGSVGGVVSTAQPGVTYTTGNFSTAPVSAQVTVTCALPVVAAPIGVAAAPIAAPRTGEGIRPPNTGDAGLADSNSSSALFIVGGLMFALAGVATLKFARR